MFDMIYNKEDTKKEKWVVYDIYIKIKGDIKSIYVGITSQLKYIKIGKDKYILDLYDSKRFKKHIRELDTNTHSNKFLQVLYNMGVKLFFKVREVIYKTRQEAKNVEKVLINCQSVDSWLLNISGLNKRQLEYKEYQFKNIILVCIEIVLDLVNTIEKVSKKTFSIFLHFIVDFLKVIIYNIRQSTKKVDNIILNKIFTLYKK